MIYRLSLLALIFSSFNVSDQKNCPEGDALKHLIINLVKQPGINNFLHLDNKERRSIQILCCKISFEDCRKPLDTAIITLDGIPIEIVENPNSKTAIFYLFNFQSSDENAKLKFSVDIEFEGAFIEGEATKLFSEDQGNINIISTIET